MLPHVHISGINAVVTFLYIVAFFGALHLLALSFPESRFANAWQALGF